MVKTYRHKVVNLDRQRVVNLVGISKSVKYECVYIHIFEDGVKLYEGLQEYFRFYNTERPHQSLDYKTPEWVYKNAAWQNQGY